MRAAAVHPAAFGAWLVIAQWRQAGARGDALTDLLTSLAAAALTAAVGWAAAARAGSPDRRGAIALLLVLWVGLYSTFAAAAGAVLPLRPAEAAWAWTALLALAAVGVRRVPVSDGASRALAITAALLVLLQGAGAAREVLAARAEAAREAAARPAPPADSRGPTRPDIHVVILDKYTSSAWLRATFGVDNAAFEDSLRALGFEVPAAARTNYTHTGLVLASLLDMAPVHERIADATAGWPAVFARIEDARVWSLMRAQGYRTVFAPTTYKGTASNRNADVVLRPPSDASTRAAWHTWTAHAPFRALASAWCGADCSRGGPAATAAVPFPVETGADITWKFAAVAALPDSAGPVFSFTHILAPHDPYQFDADCRPVPPWWPHSDAGVDSTMRAAYAAQVRCVNRQVLALVRALIARSAVPPIIVLQGDHGHGRFARDIMLGTTVPRAELPADQLAERMSVFAAYRTPGLALAWPDTITPVNVLPRILNARFGLTLPLHADRSWWVDRYSEPLRLEPLDGGALRGPGAYGASVSATSSSR